MKYTNFLPLMAVLLFSVAACGPSREEAAAFNDSIINEQKAVIETYDALLESYDTYEGEKMDAALENFTAQIKRSLTAVNNISSISGGDKLKQAAGDCFAVYLSVAENEAPEMVRLYKVPEGDFTTDMRVQWDGIYKSVDTKLKDADKKFIEVQTKFADDFKLTLDKSDK